MPDSIFELPSKSGVPTWAGVILTLIVGFFFYIYLCRVSGRCKSFGEFRTKLKEVVTGDHPGGNPLWSLVQLALDELLHIKLSITTAERETEALIKMPEPMLKSFLRQGQELARGHNIPYESFEGQSTSEIREQLRDRLKVLRGISKKVRVAPERDNTAIVGLNPTERQYFNEVLQNSLYVSGLFRKTTSNEADRAVQIINETYEDLGVPPIETYIEHKGRMPRLMDKHHKVISAINRKITPVG